MSNVLSVNQNGLAGAMQSGMEAYRNGSKQVTQESIDIANGNRQGSLANQSDINQSSVALITGELQAEVGANVISRVDDMIGTIIDTYA